MKMDKLEMSKLTDEEKLREVKDDGYMLKFIENPTVEMCLEAVRNNGYALQYINNQTEEICLEAVKNSGGVLIYVKEPTEEVCLEAVKQNGYALQYVPLEFLKDDLTEIDYSNPLDNLKFNKRTLTVSEIEKILGYEIHIIDKK